MEADIVRLPLLRTILSIVNSYSGEENDYK